MFESFAGLIVVAIMGGIFLAPTIVAFQRNHPMLIPIWIINIAFGWTLLGWVVAICWAFAYDGRRQG